MAQAQTLGSRAIKTRAAILKQAELIFAERGFAATRLEDVAAAVGIRRASLVYYFRDKREIYEAVLESILADFLVEVERALSSPDPLRQRIEASVDAWIRFVGGRPTFARLLLREVADGSLGSQSVFQRFTGPYIDVIRKHVWERPGHVRGELGVSALHLATIVAGSTVFFVAAMPQLVPTDMADPTGPDQLESHRQQMLELVRRMIEGAPTAD